MFIPTIFAIVHCNSWQKIAYMNHHGCQLEVFSLPILQNPQPTILVENQNDLFMYFLHELQRMVGLDNFSSSGSTCVSPIKKATRT